MLHMQNPGPSAPSQSKLPNTCTPIVRLNSSRLRLSLLLAAIACILRPTNILIWVPLAAPTFWQASKRLRYILLREIVLCG
jgi:phosphatidylinositol glycan class B